jgi:cytochrome P450
LIFYFLRNGEDWAKLRKPIQELILRPVAVANYVGTLASVADDFVDKYKNGGTIEDLRETLANYASESNSTLSV